MAALLAAMVTAMAPALAQYQWRDDAGQMFYSDKPPPPNIKPGQIIRAQPMAAPAPRAAPAGADAGKSALDKQMEDRKKAQERDETGRKQRDDADRIARTAQACDALRTEQRTLESGMRIATIAANGEREFMSDENRDKRSVQLKKDLSEVCSAN